MPNIHTKKCLVPYLIVVFMSFCALVGIHSLTSSSESFFKEFKHPGFLHYIDNNQYAYLANSLIDGHLYLDLPVDSHLKKLNNPYSFQERAEIAKNDNAKIYWDYAYKDGKYYCYFGVVPAVIAFVPYKIITGLDLSTPNGILFFSLLASASLALLIWLLLITFFRTTFSLSNLIIGYLIIFVGSNFQYLTFNSRFYSIPILCSLFLTYLGFSFLLIAKQRLLSIKKNPTSKVAKDRYCVFTFFFLGCFLICLNFGSRPQFLFYAFLAFPMFFDEIKERSLFSRSSVFESLGIFLGIAFALLPLFFYNYARFDSILNMGSSYNLTGFDMTTYNQSKKTTIKLIFSYLFQPVSYTSRFPYIAQSQIDLSSGWAPSEPMFGGLFSLYPVSLLIVFLPFCIKKNKQMLMFAITSFCIFVLLLIVDVRNAGVTQRYFSDFGLVLFTTSTVSFWKMSADKRLKRIVNVMATVLIAVSFFNISITTFSPDRFDSVASENPSFYSSVFGFFNGSN